MSAPTPVSEEVQQQQQQMDKIEQQMNDQQPLSVNQILVKMVIDSQNNVNKLIATQERLGKIQEQQMVYINMLINQVNNESGRSTNQQQSPNNSNDTTTNPQVSTGTITVPPKPATTTTTEEN